MWFETYITNNRVFSGQHKEQERACKINICLETFIINNYIFLASPMPSLIDGWKLWKEMSRISKKQYDENIKEDKDEKKMRTQWDNHQYKTKWPCMHLPVNKGVYFQFTQSQYLVGKCLVFTKNQIIFAHLTSSKVGQL